MNWLAKLALVFPFLLLIGCSPDEPTPPKDKVAYVGANILGYNHVAGTGINWFSVNGYRARTGGFTCCISLPEKWQPNMTVNIEWEVNPDPFPEDIPNYNDPDYKNYMKRYKSNFYKYQTTAVIPEYDESCGLQVHFLTCQQVKVTATCYGISHPDHPIKESFDQQEPTECSQ